MVVRRLALALGTLFAALGVAVAANPGLAATLRLPAVPTLFVGALAVALGLSAYLARRHTSFRDAGDDERRDELLEDRYEPPRPGADVGAALGEHGVSRRGAPANASFTERLRQLAVRVLVDARGVSRAEAHEQLDEGTWTDDATAASLFASDVDPPAEDVVGSVVGFESMYERQAHSVVVELQRIAGLDAGES